MKSRVIQDQPHEPEAQAPPTPGFRAFVRAHRLLLFFALAYVLAWGAIPWNSFFAPGALIAALVVAFTADGLAGLKAIGSRLVRWRVNWVCYVLAVGVPLFVNAATLGLTVATGAPAPEQGLIGVWTGVPLAIGIAIVNPLNGPLSEEPGFRGYAPADPAEPPHPTVVRHRPRRCDRGLARAAVRHGRVRPAAV